MERNAFTINDVNKFVLENSDCKLISKEYKNADSPITLICNCGDVYVVKFRYFKYQNRTMCKKCTDKKNGIVRDLIGAKNLIEKLSEGRCTVTSDTYIDNKTPIKIMCHCGKEFECSITNVKQKKEVQCNDCSYESFRMNKELIEFGNRCKVLDIENYTNENSTLSFKCYCGEIFFRTLKSFKMNNKECEKCSRSRISENQRLDFEDIKKEVMSSECLLVSEKSDYTNQYSKLSFRCSCGNIFERSLCNFRRLEKKCSLCSSSRGEKEVARLLSEKNICFKQEYKFDDLNSEKGFSLRFDFAVFNDTGELISLIEYDGEFHYEALISEQEFRKQKHHDNLKNKYCIKNNIPLIRIPYFEYENIEIILDKFICKLMPR